MLAELLEIPARELARVAEREWRGWRRRPRGATLRPGPDTPLWLVLAAAVAPRLRKRGARAALARELGLHRMRMTEFFVARNAMPDAERTLALLLWLAREQRTPLPPAARMRKSP